jgi:hypothetical protein
VDGLNSTGTALTPENAGALASITMEPLDAGRGRDRADGGATANTGGFPLFDDALSVPAGNTTGAIGRGGTTIGSAESTPAASAPPTPRGPVTAPFPRRPG